MVECKHNFKTIIQTENIIDGIQYYNKCRKCDMRFVSKFYTKNPKNGIIIPRVNYK